MTSRRNPPTPWEWPPPSSTETAPSAQGVTRAPAYENEMEMTIYLIFAEQAGLLNRKSTRLLHPLFTLIELPIFALPSLRDEQSEDGDYRFFRPKIPDSIPAEDSHDPHLTSGADLARSARVTASLILSSPAAPRCRRTHLTTRPSSQHPRSAFLCDGPVEDSIRSASENRSVFRQNFFLLGYFGDH
ncbi:Hypothetical protein NTJ_03411 [Nesidiocoris tenuis]|uniref:Uncharacterized protein n=1 Tax=Nesidiocoris tenuis TaxID=355587 RepID=A0ABN7AEY4_9HEMI|nr:Hypothetical protein NTJ_03411 [Nesidiocoris tenuis]